MTQRYTVELERINVYCATLEIEAETLAEAQQFALARVRAAPNHWEANVGKARVVKVINHGKAESHVCI